MIALKQTLTVLGLIWGLQLVWILGPGAPLGIVPRHVDGLLGILTTPFVHKNWEHLGANTLGLGPLLFIMFVLRKSATFWLLLWIVFLGGILTWGLARPGIHIGASGVVFGAFGYLVLAGFYRHEMKFIFVSIGVAILYGGMIYGVLPNISGEGPLVSWEAHLFGLIGGLSAARLDRKTRSPYGS